MRKSYKEQMDEIHMPQTLREKILQETKTITGVEKCEKYLHKQLQIALSCVVLCVITGLMLYTMREDQVKEYREEKVESKRKSLDKKDYGGIGGPSENYDRVRTGSGIHALSVLPIDLFEGKILPVYEFHEAKELIEIKELASKLKVDWDDTLLVGANDTFQMEANVYGYYAVNDTRAYEALPVEDIFDKYRIYLPVENPIQECDEQGCSVYEKGDYPEETYIHKALFAYQFQIMKAVDEETYHTSFIGFDRSRLQVVKKVKIMTQKDAEEALLAGMYYSSFDKPASLVKENIQSVTLMYSALGSKYETYPYMLPIYQFIVREDEMDYICNVVALKQEDLNDLDQVDWNFQ